MSKFENKSRECYEDMVAFTAANVLNVKKKEFLSKIKKAGSAEEFYNYVVKTAAIRTSNWKAVSKELTNYLYYFDIVKRYWVQEFDKDSDIDIKLSTMENLFEEEGAAVVESEILGNPAILLCEKLSSPVRIAGAPFEYKVTWYANGTSKKGIDVSVVLASAYVSKDKGIVITVSDVVSKTSKLDGMSMTIDGERRYCLRHGTQDKQTKQIVGFVSVAVHLVSYVGYCIKHKETLTRKNGVAAKKYESVKVHVAKPEECGDRVIPLHTHVKEYSYIGKQEYKGGHHKSPIEHDRCGYYRKSRGVGDYDYVNGEFVYVGKRQGKYSYVQACHISGNKGNVVYKV